ncbi:hypothetical protein HN695_05960 [Candidatus Woesearchaeota archaeon]|jgi:hypothetical protein|nr:hypothetical protein [Candidatus Woesearchaeota archaeon]MBT5272574.1 hypothetical protein [Candidatus Woesearchaeota archaeon]MBT6040569.1 hypothetical protein [Candidatus Woesearchaeota archaeon]MBT6337126.1 hypothetical protein [Candidatus Woesearchaeota archaeon]MBT7927854.1 hypothetical protein [Candidatus Woesearchaeota archaeon]
MVKALRYLITAAALAGVIQIANIDQSEVIPTVVASEAVVASDTVESSIGPGEVSSAELEKIVQQKLKIGAEVKKLLDREYDKVGVYIFEREITNPNTGETRLYKDLLVRGYETDKYGDWPQFGVNLDCVCRALHEEKKLFGFINVKDVVRFHTCTGNIVNTENMKHKNAILLNKIVSMYVGNNGEMCERFDTYINKTHGPTGPAYHK